MNIPADKAHLFWSKDVHSLDSTQDKPYIIHQTLAYGTLEDMHWLFQTYPKQVIIDTFMKYPIKTYTPSSLHLAMLVLGIPPNTIRSELYDNTIPRHIGS